MKKSYSAAYYLIMNGIAFLILILSFCFVYINHIILRYGIAICVGMLIIALLFTRMEREVFLKHDSDDDAMDY